MKTINLALSVILLFLYSSEFVTAQAKIKPYTYKSRNGMVGERIHPDSVFVFNDTVFVVIRLLRYKPVRPDSIYINHYVYTKNRDSMKTTMPLPWALYIPAKGFVFDKYRANPVDSVPSSLENRVVAKKRSRGNVIPLDAEMRKSRYYGAPDEFEWVLSVLKSRDKKTKNKKK